MENVKRYVQKSNEAQSEINNDGNYQVRGDRFTKEFVLKMFF